MTGTNGSNRAVLYARVSSKDQEREGFSIPAQLKLLRQYAREQQLTIVREFVDVETAKQSGRGGFGEMIAALKADTSCRTVLVEKTDRLYRNIKDWMTVDDLDVTIHFVKENAVVSKDSRSSDKFLHGIKVLMAKNYVDNLSEEVKKGLLEKAEQGHWPGRAPVGYLDNLARHRIEADRTRGPLVTKLFEWYATGQYSLRAVTTRAHAAGLTHPRSGRRMMKAEIHRILQNPIYTGDFRWNGRMYRGSHDPLITHDTFATVQAVLNRKPRARYPKQRHAFMGLLTCARCGCAMTAERKKGKYTYYRCTAFHGRWGNAYIREEQLAELLGGVVNKIQLPERVANVITARLHASQADLEQARSRSSARLLDRQRTLQAKIDRGYDDYVEHRISDALWARKSAEWETELATVTAQLGVLERPTTTFVATGEKILELVKRAGILYKTQDPVEQRRVLDSVLSNCTFDRGSVCPTYKKPFDLFARATETGEWRGRRDSNSS
jgi:DNA invertase Pin-like site-specific DNA recombinase